METDVFEIFEYTIEKLDGQTRALQAEYREHMQCRVGCSACCQDGFRIRYVEALHLLKGFIQASPETAQAILENLTNPTEENRQKCPMLVNGACGVYANRPSLCRAYGLMLQLKENISTCKLNFTELPEKQAMKVLDIAPYYVLLDDLSDRIWDQSPRAEVSTDAEAPNLSIRQFFEKFLGIQPESQPETTPAATA
jgi:uncharacterized protein